MPTRISGKLPRHQAEGSGILASGPAPRPQRVLMTADGVGGVWPYALELASGLGQHGVQVTVAVLGPPLAGHQLAEAARHGLDLHEGGYALEWMPDAWDDVDAAGQWLLGLERSLAPDIVHLNGYCHAALPWRAPTVVVGHSCVRSWWKAVHGSEPPTEWSQYSARVAAGLDAASLVVAPTGAMLHELRVEYGWTGRAQVINNGSATVQHGRTGAPAAAREPIIFSAGRLWDEAKNIEALCAVAPSLRWPVTVAGDTRGPHGLCTTAGDVNCLGLVPHEEIQRWLERASIYVLPARYEPFGLSVLEAAAAGCALVLGDIRSLRENWGDAALFVPPDNRRALASAIQSLIEDPGRRQALGQRAGARARQFTPGRMVAGYLGAYGAVMSHAAVIAR